MAMDMTWLLSAKDDASAVFDKVKQSGTAAADGIQGAFNGVISKFNLVTGVVGTLATVAGGMVFKALIGSTIDWDLSAGKLANTLGMTTEQASVYMVAMRKVGVDQDVAEKAGMKLAMTLGKNEAVFQQLGVATRDTSGHLRSTADLMPEVNSKLNAMAAGTDRNVIAMQIYGRSWGEIRSLLKINSDVMEEARKTAERLHLIVGEEGVKQAKKYKENLNDLKLVGTSLEIQFGNVLLPTMVKVGAWLGKEGPLLSDAFGIALNTIGKAIYTVGSMAGLSVLKLVSMGTIVKDLATGDFSAARSEFDEMKGQTAAFIADMKKTWTEWDDPKKASKGKGGNLLDTTTLEETKKALAAVSSEIDKYAKSINSLGKDQLDLAKSGYTEDLKKQQELLKANSLQVFTMEQPLRNYLAVIDQVYGQQITMQTAIGQTLFKIGADQREILQQNIVIATTEKTQIEARLGAWTQYLKNLQEMHAQTLDGMKKKQQELFDIKLKTGDLTLQVQQTLMTPLQKYYSTVADLDQKQKLAMALNGDEKIKLLGEVQSKWASLTSEIKNGDDVVISQANAVAGALYKIKQIGGDLETEKAAQIGQLSDRAQSLEFEMKKAADQIDLYQAKIRDLDTTIANLTRKFDLTMTDAASPVIDKVKGALDSLRDKTITITANYVSAYGSQIDPLPSYDVGTPYVPRTGPAIIHQGERIITAADNASGRYSGNHGESRSADTYQFNGDVILPNVTNQTSARELFAEFKKLARQQAA